MQPVHCRHVGARRRRPCRRRRSRRRRRSARPGAARARPRRSPWACRPERLMTQLEITTSTLRVGQRDLLDVALEQLDVLDAGLGVRSCGRARASRRSCRVRSAVPVGPTRRAEISTSTPAPEPRSSTVSPCVQVGDRGRDAAAERGERRRRRALVALARPVQRCAEHLGLLVSDDRARCRSTSSRHRSRSRTSACGSSPVALRAAHGVALAPASRTLSGPGQLGSLHASLRRRWSTERIVDRVGQLSHAGRAPPGRRG